MIERKTLLYIALAFLLLGWMLMLPQAIIEHLSFKSAVTYGLVFTTGAIVVALFQIYRELHQ